MGMFIVEKGTTVKGIQNGKEWYPQNFVVKSLRETMVFDKSQLVIDPTGIAKYASTPGGPTIGAFYAEAGYYGFSYSGWTLLIKADKVKYG